MQLTANQLLPVVLKVQHFCVVNQEHDTEALDLPADVKSPALLVFVMHTITILSCSAMKCIL